MALEVEASGCDCSRSEGGRLGEADMTLRCDGNGNDGAAIMYASE